MTLENNLPIIIAEIAWDIVENAIVKAVTDPVWESVTYSVKDPVWEIISGSIGISVHDKLIGYTFPKGTLV